MSDEELAEHEKKQASYEPMEYFEDTKQWKKTRHRSTFFPFNK